MGETLGLMIAAARKQQSLSLQKAAKLAGITKAHLWDLEQGRSHDPRASTLVGLARAYGIDVASLAYAAVGQSEPLPLVRGDYIAANFPVQTC